MLAVGQEQAVYRGEHIVLAERALGRPLSMVTPVHHVDGNRANNAPFNLVICQSHKYHMLLHVRTRIVRAGGNPNTDKICATCQSVKPRGAFHLDRSRPDGLDKHCRPCKRERDLRRNGIAVISEQAPWGAQ